MRFLIFVPGSVHCGRRTSWSAGAFAVTAALVPAAPAAGSRTV